MKKTLTITLIIIVVIALGFLVWFLLFPASSAPVVDKVKDILPFGSDTTTQIDSGGQESVLDENTAELLESGKPVAGLFRISSTPIAGAVTLQKNTVGTTSSQTIVRYVDRATGHIYDLNLLTFEKVKISNTTIPKVYEAIFRSDGSAVVMRTLSENGGVQNTSFTLTPPKTTSTDAMYSITGVGLRGDIGEIVAGQGDTLFYSLNDTGSIVSSTFSGGSLKTLYSSKFTNWRITPSGKNLLIYTKASSATPGYAYSLKNTGGNLIKILGPLNGLVVIPNSVGGYAYSYNDEGLIKLFGRKDSKSADISLPSTITEKCVWSKKEVQSMYCAVSSVHTSSGEPENWYGGVTHFIDEIWKFDVNDETGEVVIEPSKIINIDMDVINPTLTPNEDYLVFTNKNDLSLWVLKLE